MKQERRQEEESRGGSVPALQLKSKKGGNRSRERVVDTEKEAPPLSILTLVSKAPSLSRARSVWSVYMMGPWGRVLSEMGALKGSSCPQGPSTRKWRPGRRELGPRLRETKGSGDILGLGNNLVRGIFGFGGLLGLGSMLGIGPILSLGAGLGLGYYLGLEAWFSLGTPASYPVLTAACPLFLRAL